MASIKGGLRHARSKPKTFGERLREARQRAGLSVVEAARRMKVARTTFYSWEENTRRPPRDVAALAKLVETTVAVLYGERAS
jgi:transcriptional regulator with XRE-family HTH domain